jgi:hypothetical protein
MSVETITKKQLSIKCLISNILEETKALVVDDEQKYKHLNFIYSNARQLEKELENERKKLVEPYRKQINAINDKAKELSAPIGWIIEVTNTKAGEWRALLQRRKEEEEKELNEAASLFGVTTAVHIAPVPKSVSTEDASCILKRETKFKVSDISKVPMKYLKIDEELVKRDLKLGIADIPGIEIWEETTTQLRRR